MAMLGRHQCWPALHWLSNAEQQLSDLLDEHLAYV